MLIAYILKKIDSAVMSAYKIDWHTQIIDKKNTDNIVKINIYYTIDSRDLIFHTDTSDI